MTKPVMLVIVILEIVVLEILAIWVILHVSYRSGVESCQAMTGSSMTNTTLLHNGIETKVWMNKDLLDKNQTKIYYPMNRTRSNTEDNTT